MTDTQYLDEEDLTADARIERSLKYLDELEELRAVTGLVLDDASKFLERVKK